MNVPYLGGPFDGKVLTTDSFNPDSFYLVSDPPTHHNGVYLPQGQDRRWQLAWRQFRDDGRTSTSWTEVDWQLPPSRDA